MVVDDDEKENFVSPTAANTLLTGEFTEPAAKSTPLRVVSGNSQSEGLAGLFRDHYTGMLRVAYRITGSHDDAEDVLQNVFVRLTRGWTGRDLSPNPRAFLYRAAINASLDVVRTRKRANSVPLELLDFDQTPKVSTPNPEQNLADSELQDLVRALVTDDQPARGVQVDR